MSNNKLQKIIIVNSTQIDKIEQNICCKLNQNDIILYRDYQIEQKVKQQQIQYLSYLINKYKIQLFIAQDIQMVLKFKCHGLHISEYLYAKYLLKIQNIIQSQKIKISISSHSYQSLVKYIPDNNIDYILFSKLFYSNSYPENIKQNYLGITKFNLNLQNIIKLKSDNKSNVIKKIFALGGINKNNQKLISKHSKCKKIAGTGQFL